jgi:hypothetical protein
MRWSDIRDGRIAVEQGKMDTYARGAEAHSRERAAQERVHPHEQLRQEIQNYESGGRESRCATNAMAQLRLFCASDRLILARRSTSRPQTFGRGDGGLLKFPPLPPFSSRVLRFPGFPN